MNIMDERKDKGRCDLKVEGKGREREGRRVDRMERREKGERQVSLGKGRRRTNKNDG